MNNERVCVVCGKRHTNNVSLFCDDHQDLPTIPVEYKDSTGEDRVWVDDIYSHLFTMELREMEGNFFPPQFSSLKREFPKEYAKVRRLAQRYNSPALEFKASDPF